jgi:hypothetical protein
LRRFFVSLHIDTTRKSGGLESHTNQLRSIHCWAGTARD